MQTHRLRDNITTSSSREGIISRCRRFDLLHFAVLSQSDTAVIVVVAAHVRCRWRSTDRDRRTMVGRCFIQINNRAADSIFAILVGVFRV